MNLGSQSIFHVKSKSWALLIVGVLAGVTIGGGVGVIAASSTKTVTVCSNKKTTVLRYAKNGKCAKTETKVVLNQMGVAGVKGDTGAAGTNGTNGVAGVKGDAGTNATLAITQQSVCDGSDADATANEVCKMGMTGPGGGLIFFVDYNNEYATYDYLEAAPADGVFASNAATGGWATIVPTCGTVQDSSCQSNSIYAETLFALTTVKGSHRGLFGGKAATAAIVARHDAGAQATAKNLYAAGVADDYVAKGKSDWWLPSKDELQKMQENLNNNGVGGFTSALYWSSSEWDAVRAWSVNFGHSDQDNTAKTNPSYVRSVRGF